MAVIVANPAQGRRQFVDANGNPLAGGKVYYYTPSTTTFKATYSDAGGTTPNANPVVLDASGSAPVYGAGSYREYVTDALGNLIQDAVSVIVNDAALLTYSPAGAGATVRALSAKLADNVSVADFGAKGDGVTNNDAAFAAAQAYVASASAAGQHVNLTFPAGLYLYTVSPNWAVNHTTHTALGEVRLRYSGTGNAWIFDGGLTTQVFGLSAMGNFIIEAPSSALDGLYVRACHHSRFQFRVRGCGSASAAVHIIFNVCSEYLITVSNNEDGGYYSATPPPIGILLDTRTGGEFVSYCLFQMPVIEGVPQGIVVNGGLGNLFQGGTSEGCSVRGVNVGTASLNNKFIGMDFESNTTQDIYCSGNYNSFIDCDSLTQTTIDTPGVGNALIGGAYQSVTIGSGSVATLVSGIHYNRTGPSATITDNGTKTRLRDNLNIQTQNITNAPLVANTPAVGASPFTYTNTSGGEQTVLINGGTVSSLQYVRGGVGNVIGVTSGMFTLSPTDGIIITYTVAPTFLTYTR